MRVFISWSGQRSRDVAVALRDWLPLLINEVEAFVSAKDIYAGARWQLEIASQLETTNFGLVCVTRSNQRAPWINFEAGALAKAVDSSRVIPIAIDLTPSEIEMPMGQFQAQPLTEAGIQDILASINSLIASPLKEHILARSVTMWWPELNSALQDILSEPDDSPRPDERSDRELLEETLSAVRSILQTGLSAPSSVDQHHAELLRARARASFGIAGPGFSLETLRQLWPEVLEEVKQRRRFTWILLSQNAAPAEFRDGTLRISMANASANNTFVRGDNARVLQEALLAVTGIDFQIETIVADR